MFLSSLLRPAKHGLVLPARRDAPLALSTRITNTAVPLRRVRERLLRHEPRLVPRHHRPPTITAGSGRRSAQFPGRDVWCSPRDLRQGQGGTLRPVEHHPGLNHPTGGGGVLPVQSIPRAERLCCAHFGKRAVLAHLKGSINPGLVGLLWIGENRMPGARWSHTSKPIERCSTVQHRATCRPRCPYSNVAATHSSTAPLRHKYRRTFPSSVNSVPGKCPSCAHL